MVYPVPTSWRKRSVVILLFLIIASIMLTLSLCSNERIVKPETGPIIDAVYALGTVKTDKIYNARFGMNTIIRKLYVHEGDNVQKGSPLVLGDTAYPLKAPFAGVVTVVNYLENEMATAGQTVITVSSITDLYVRVTLDQESIISVRKGQNAELSFENLRDEKVNGVVEAAYLSGDEFIVRISAAKFPAGVLPQMTCDAAITVSRKENALMIPSAAVRAGKVERIRNGNRALVPVSVKKMDSGRVEVVSGDIQPDDRIVISESKDRVKK